MTVQQHLTSFAFAKAKVKQHDLRFGFNAFLAGLIDADGYIGKKAISISFHQRDAGVAYELQTILGYGIVRHIKGKKALSFDVYDRQCRENLLLRVGSLLRAPHRQASVNACYSHLGCCFSNNALFDGSRWLAGFIQGDGSFQIKLTKRNSKTPVRVHVVIQIDQKSNVVLKAIQSEFGGSVSYRRSQNTYSYTSGSFINAGKFKDYLDAYQVSHLNFSLYCLWRRAVLVVQWEQHRSPEGLLMLQELKKSLTRLKATS